MASREWNRKHYERKRAWLDSIKNVPCVDCGGIFPPECMDFDHVRGEKKFGIAYKIKGSFEMLLEEIAKCEIVCANCHRIRTKKRNQKGGST